MPGKGPGQSTDTKMAVGQNQETLVAMVDWAPSFDPSYIYTRIKTPKVLYLKQAKQAKSWSLCIQCIVTLLASQKYKIIML